MECLYLMSNQRRLDGRSPFLWGSLTAAIVGINYFVGSPLDNSARYVNVSDQPISIRTSRFLLVSPSSRLLPSIPFILIKSTRMKFRSRKSLNLAETLESIKFHFTNVNNHTAVRFSFSTIVQIFVEINIDLCSAEQKHDCINLFVSTIII